MVVCGVDRVGRPLTRRGRGHVRFRQASRDQGCARGEGAGQKRSGESTGRSQPGDDETMSSSWATMNRNGGAMVVQSGGHGEAIEHLSRARATVASRAWGRGTSVCRQGCWTKCGLGGKREGAAGCAKTCRDKGQRATTCPTTAVRVQNSGPVARKSVHRPVFLLSLSKSPQLDVLSSCL